MIEDTIRDILNEVLENRLHDLIEANEKLISRGEVLKRLGISNSAFKQLSALHDIPFYELGRSKKGYRWSEVLMAIKRNPSKANIAMVKLLQIRTAEL